MNKLQLYIYKAVRGFKSVQNINPAENIQRHIRDARQAMEVLDYDPAEKYLFYLLSYINEGIFLTILRTIPEKRLDHLASTIFIPNGLIIGKEELAEVVDRTTRIVSNPTVTSEDIAELHELFGKEYPEEEEAPAMVESQGREYAFSYYGGDTEHTLDDFFGNKIYQTEYLKYAGVLLVDGDLGVTAEGVDLTDHKLCEPAVIYPPEEYPNGFAPFVYGHQFNRPFRASLSKTVEIVWRRKGFGDIKETVEVDSPQTFVEVGQIDDSRKIISPSSFYITGHGGKRKIEDVEIVVNGIDITGEHSFSYDDLKNANVVVRAQGFRPYMATLDLAATSQALISLHEQLRVYRFELPVKSTELGSPIKFEIHTKRQLTDSPLEGYSLVEEMKEGSGKSNHLQYTGGVIGVPIKQALIYAGAALVAGFLLGWLVLGSSAVQVADENKAEEPKTQVEQTVVEVKKPEKVVEQKAEQPKPEKKEEGTSEAAPAPKAAAPEVAVTAASIAYLDGNQKWTREELEQQPGLAGLFDDMNAFNLDRIINYWGPKLSKSKRFEKVSYHAKESARKKIFKPEGSYCTDGSISVQAYLYRIDPAKK